MGKIAENEPMCPESPYRCIARIKISYSNKKWGNYYNYFYVGSIVFSALVTVEVVIGIIDLAFALMCIPNMIAMVYLAKRVKNEMQERNWLN